MKKTKLLLALLFVSSFCFAQDYYLKVTLTDGPFKGTHKFAPEKGNYMSQINLEYFEGVSNLNASKLVSEDGKIQIHYINRHFLGEASTGNHKAKKHTSGCGSFNFIDLKNEYDYKKINGDFNGCSITTIKSVGKWKDGIVKKRRLVSGTFKDTLKMEYVMDNGSKKIVESQINVEFTVNESRRK